VTGRRPLSAEKLNTEAKPMTTEARKNELFLALEDAEWRKQEALKELDRATDLLEEANAAYEEAVAELRDIREQCQELGVFDEQ